MQDILSKPCTMGAQNTKEHTHSAKDEYRDDLTDFLGVKPGGCCSERRSMTTKPTNLNLVNVHMPNNLSQQRGVQVDFAGGQPLTVEGGKRPRNPRSILRSPSDIKLQDNRETSWQAPMSPQSVSASEQSETASLASSRRSGQSATSRRSSHSDFSQNSRLSVGRIAWPDSESGAYQSGRTQESMESELVDLTSRIMISQKTYDKLRTQVEVVNVTHKCGCNVE